MPEENIHEDHRQHHNAIAAPALQKIQGQDQQRRQQPRRKKSDARGSAQQPGLMATARESLPDSVMALHQPPVLFSPIPKGAVLPPQPGIRTRRVCWYQIANASHAIAAAHASTTGGEPSALSSFHCLLLRAIKAKPTSIEDRREALATKLTTQNRLKAPQSAMANCVVIVATPAELRPGKPSPARVVAHTVTEQIAVIRQTVSIAAASIFHRDPGRSCIVLRDDP